MRKLFLLFLVLACGVSQAAEVRAVRLQAPATNTTQDYTISGFGTAQAVIVFGGTAGDGSDGAPMRQSYGFWDTSNVAAWFTAHDDGVAVASSQTRSGNSSSNIVEMLTAGVGTERSATISAVTDGIRLTWAGSDTTIRPYIIVVLINDITGAAVGALTPSGTDTGTAQATGLGITPNVIFGGMNRANIIDSDLAWVTSSIGMAYDNGVSIEQVSWSWNSCCATGGTAYRSTDDVAINIGNATVDTTLEITATASGSFTATTHNVSGSGQEHSDLYYLAMEIADGVDMQQAEVPTSDQDWTAVTGAGFTVDSVIAITTSNASSRGDTVETNNDAGHQGFYVANANEDFGHYCAMEDNASTNSNTSCRSDTQLLTFDETAGTPESQADNPSFGSGSITYPQASFEPATQGHMVLFMVFESGAGGTSVPILNSHRRRRAQ